MNEYLMPDIQEEKILEQINNANAVLDALSIAICGTTPLGVVVLESTRTGKQYLFPEIEDITWLQMLSCAGPSFQQSVTEPGKWDKGITGKIPFEYFIECLAIAAACHHNSTGDNNLNIQL